MEEEQQVASALFRSLALAAVSAVAAGTNNKPGDGEVRVTMSAFGTKQTCPARHIMSVLGGKADIKDAVSDFRSWHQADVHMP